MNELLEMLEQINPNNEYKNEKNLVDDGLLDSLSLMELVSEIEDVYNVSISPADMIPDNFNSVDAMWAMVERLKKK